MAKSSGHSSSRVSYQHPSGGASEILRPTLVVSGGRSYRKLTDVRFGRKEGDQRDELLKGRPVERLAQEAYVGVSS